jgi:hypothetical protein
MELREYRLIGLEDPQRKWEIAIAKDGRAISLKEDRKDEKID